MYAYVGRFAGGSCALAVGNIIIEGVMAIVIRIAIKKAAVLFFAKFIFLFSLKFMQKICNYP
jgi:hypothetical protein